MAAPTALPAKTPAALVAAMTTPVGTRSTRHVSWRACLGFAVDGGPPAVEKERHAMVAVHDLEPIRCGQVVEGLHREETH